jgi:hypothetical protein
MFTIGPQAGGIGQCLVELPRMSKALGLILSAEKNKLFSNKFDFVI